MVITKGVGTIWIGPFKPDEGIEGFGEATHVFLHEVGIQNVVSHTISPKHGNLPGVTITPQVDGEVAPVLDRIKQILLQHLSSHQDGDV